MIDWSKVGVRKTTDEERSIFTSIRRSSYVGYHLMIFAVDTEGRGFVLASESDLYDGDLFDGPFLEDNIENDVPKEPGLYKCQVRIHSFRCNHPEDPEEWDLTITLEDIVKLKSELDDMLDNEHKLNTSEQNTNSIDPLSGEKPVT